MFRTVLVHVDSQKASDNRTRAAMSVARQFDATLIGLTAALPQLPMELYDVSLGTVAVSDFTEFDRRHVEAEFGKAAEAFKKATQGAGLETGWRAVFELPSQALIQTAAAADLLVIGSGTPSVLSDLGSAAAGDIVLRTGRPILVVPEAVDRLAMEPKVLVAWKDTPEAQRAIADAVPFMKRAESVTVVHIEEAGSVAELGEVAGYLMRHGIAVKTNVAKSTGDAPEAQILDIARQTGADLIVAGAYGHSRLREWAFGGMTRGLLTQSSIPCLLSH
jgi:nucleotide-binding universal stress UspA family protein